MASGEVDLGVVLPHVGANGNGHSVVYADRIGAGGPESWGTSIREVVTNDRVSETAEDMPSTDTLPALADPAADHEDAALAARRADVEEKHGGLVAYLDETGLDAVVLGRADSLAWFTSGGDLGQSTTRPRPASAWAFVNRKCRSLFTDNVQSARVFEEEVAGLGFQLKERPWYRRPRRGRLRPRPVQVDRLRRRPARLSPTPGRLRALRWPLSTVERQRLRELGRTLTLAVEATCRNFQPGETEADIAGHLAHRLLREGVDAGRASGSPATTAWPAIASRRSRPPPIRNRATIAAVGRRHGLCASATRTVSFGPVDAEFRAAHTPRGDGRRHLHLLLPARRGRSPRSSAGAKRIYEKFDHPHEWTLDYQGALIGYSPREMVLRPELTTRPRPRDWPSAGAPRSNSARSEDTVVVDARGYEVVTEAQDWPKIEVQVKGFTMPRPAILER